MNSRYVVFGFDTFYPCGGWHDMIGHFTRLEDARKLAETTDYYRTQIVDLETMETIDD